MKKSIVLLAVLFCLNAMGQKPKWQSFSMQGNECRIFISAGNSRIIVPSMCFESNNETYLGPVEIEFIEYKDQADFILSGLSLRYEVNGKLHSLQSGGMFEIKFKEKNKSKRELKIKTGKKITVKFAIDPRFDVAGLEPFYFNKDTKNWEKLTRYGKTAEGNQIVSDQAGDLWQDAITIPEVFGNGDDVEVDCYTISVPDKNNPDLFIDTVICPTNTLDNRYYSYLNDQAFKTMQIENMGLYNYDKIFDEENAIPLFVNLKSKDGKAIDLKGELYVVYKNSNSVIYYHKEDLLAKFTLIPRNDIKIFAYNTDGTVLKVPDSFWSGIDIKTLRNQTLTLPFETLKLATLSKDEFAKVTGLAN
jgi:hypothetical protein